MSLEDALASAGERLASGALPNEAQVQASVIRPVLRALGWDDTDPAQWRVEFQVDHGRVDEALFDPAGLPLVFVEAKKQGNLSIKAEDQLFGYAAHNGVPTLVLTDGNTWDLYLSMAAGKPADRRFAHLVISEAGSLDGMADDLRQFLGREAVLSGTADDAAKARLRQVKDREQGKTGLQQAWTALLSKPDERLRDLLIERVEQDVRARPTVTDTEEFLRRQVGPVAATGGAHTFVTVPTAAVSSPDQAPLSPIAGRHPAATTSRNVEVVIRGNRHEADNGQAAMALLAGTLQQQNSGFLERYRDEAAPGAHKRPPAVRDDALNDYLKDQIRRRNYRQVDGFPDWWIYVNLKTARQAERMQVMAEIAGLPWGVDEGVRLIRRVAG